MHSISFSVLLIINAMASPMYGSTASFDESTSADISDLFLSWMDLQGDLNETVCGRDILKIVAGLEAKETWALRVFDSFGKPKAGLLLGALHWEGSYAQCLNVKKNAYVPIDSQYCWIRLSMAPAAISSFQPILKYNLSADKINNSPTVNMAICMPESCSSDELLPIVEFLYDLLPKGLKNVLQLKKVTCLPKRLDILSDWAAVTSLFICCFTGLLLLAATFYDLVIYQPKLKEKYPSLPDPHLEANECHSELLIPDKALKKKMFRLDKKLGLIPKLFLSFSVYTNGKRLFNMNQSEGILTSLHGIRVFSMTWVILGHTLMFSLRNIDNIMEFIEILKGFWMIIVMHFHFAVDSFFLISGLLLTYHHMKDNERSNTKSWMHFYIHRYIRLTPVYMMVLLLIHSGLSKYLGYGPFWPQQKFDGDACDNTWWAHLLYVNNFIDFRHQCMPITWYLAVDMQIYIFTPIILIPLQKRPAVAGVIGAVILAGASIVTGLLSYSLNLDYVLDVEHMSPGTDVHEKLYEKIYSMPWTHTGPYVIGMAMGWLLSKINSPVHLRPSVVALGWTTAIICGLGSLFISYQRAFSVLETSFYLAWVRSIWALSLSWMIFACSTGYGGIVNHVLSWPTLIPLSRLSYSAYLIHETLMLVLFYNLDQPNHYSAIFLITNYMAITVYCYLLATPLYLAFETPIMALERLWYTKK